MAKKKQMGRPPLPDGEARTAWMQIRLTDAEKETFQLAASRAGQSLSEWAKERLSKAVKRESK
jgi:predicted HicB family RNase H-like nuclease